MRVCPAQDRHRLRHNHALGSPLPARSGLSANLLRDADPLPAPPGPFRNSIVLSCAFSQGLCLRGGLFHISSLGTLSS